MGQSKILVACEYSGRVREAFAALGFDAWSCDLLPSEIEGKHFQCDVREVLGKGWDLLIAHPPCTYLSRAGARWWKDEERKRKADQAAEFVFLLRDAPISKIAIENPIGQLNRRWRYPDQTIQPYQFGDPFSKATCLWLKGLPKLWPTNVLSEHRPLIRANVTKRARGGIPQTGTYSGGLVTAKTFPGIAAAMAQQWGLELF